MSALDVGKVRGFILQIPKPITVRISSTDGATDELKVGRQSFMRMAETICAVDPELVECLDKEGALIRAMRPEELVVVEPPRDTELPDELKGDKVSAQLNHFANLLSQAYRHSTDVAFNKLVDLVERGEARYDAMERRLDRAENETREALRDQIDAEMKRVEESALGKDGAPNEGQALEMLQAMMGGISQGKTVTPPNGKA